jgi:hypothetical protein
VLAGLTSSSRSPSGPGAGAATVGVPASEAGKVGMTSRGLCALNCPSRLPPHRAARNKPPARVRARRQGQLACLRSAAAEPPPPPARRPEASVSGMAMMDRRRLACPAPAGRGVWPDDVRPAGDMPGALPDRNSPLAPLVSMCRSCLRASRPEEGGGVRWGASAPGGLEAKRADLDRCRAKPRHSGAAGLVGVDGRHSHLHRVMRTKCKLKVLVYQLPTRYWFATRRTASASDEPPKSPTVKEIRIISSACSSCSAASNSTYSSSASASSSTGTVDRVNYTNEI